MNAVYVGFYPYSRCGYFPEYLIESSKRFLFIEFDMHHSKQKRPSNAFLYENGKLKYKKELKILKHIPRNHLSVPLFHLIYINQIKSLVKKLSERTPFDFFISPSALWTVKAGLPLKKAEFLRNIVFWSWDYYVKPIKENEKINILSILINPKHFYSFLLDINRKVEDEAFKQADMVWFLAKANLERRLKEGQNIDLSKSKIVPFGVYPSNPDVKAKKDIVGTIGYLEEGNFFSIFSFLKAMKICDADFTFEIIGDGPKRKEIEEKIRELGLEDRVNILGYISDPEKKQEVMSRWTAGVGIYRRKLDDGTPTLVEYTDHSKLKEFIGAGVPLITTDAPEIHKEIEKYRAGEVIEEPVSEEKLCKAVKKIVQNKTRYIEGVKRMIDVYDYKKHYSKYLK